MSSRPSLTRNTIFLATQLPNKNFDFFLPLILRLWKITRVCDIFHKDHKDPQKSTKIHKDSQRFTQHLLTIILLVGLLTGKKCTPWCEKTKSPSLKTGRHTLLKLMKIKRIFSIQLHSVGGLLLLP